MRIRLPLNWRTRNYVGTIFGGSLYGAVDPIYMIMLIKALGPDYVVWDKAATIRFLRPGRGTLHATFQLTAEEVAALRTEVDHAGKVEREFTAQLLNAAGDLHASSQKLLGVRRRQGTRPGSESSAMRRAYQRIRLPGGGHPRAEALRTQRTVCVFRGSGGEH